MNRSQKPRPDARKAALARKRKANRAHRVDIMRTATGANSERYLTRLMKKPVAS